MANLEFFQFNCRQDNFGVLIHDATLGITASIDAPDTGAIKRALAEKGWSLTHILCTHHHFDHVEGNLALKEEFGCEIIGPKDEADKIPGFDRGVSGGESFEFGTSNVEVIASGGHTLGEICYHFPESKVVFTGDTLFALGCGRVFEGDPPMMWQSLQRLMQLPADTQVYCGHEYTLTNARFAVTIDPDNEQLNLRAKEIEQLRGDGKPTLPTTIGVELATNPFLRPDNAAIRKVLAMENSTDVEVFAEIRHRKDNF